MVDKTKSGKLSVRISAVRLLGKSKSYYQNLSGSTDIRVIRLQKVILEHPALGYVRIGHMFNSIYIREFPKWEDVNDCRVAVLLILSTALDSVWSAIVPD